MEAGRTYLGKVVRLVGRVEGRRPDSGEGSCESQDIPDAPGGLAGDYRSSRFKPLGLYGAGVAYLSGPYGEHQAPQDRGEIYLVSQPGRNDPKRQRAFVVVSRQALIATKFSTVICAPVDSRHDGLATQVAVGVNEGLKWDSSIHGDERIRVPKAMLTRYAGRLGQAGIGQLRKALIAALDLTETSGWL